MVTTEERVSRREGAYDHLATKSDVAKLETKMGELESKLTWRRLVGLLIQAGLVVALVKLLP